MAVLQLVIAKETHRLFPSEKTIIRSWGKLAGLYTSLHDDNCTKTRH